MNTELIEKCKNIAIEAHEGQFRKFGNKEPYINHPLRCAEIVEKLFNEKIYNLNNNDLEMMICAALLHDTLEDTEVTLEYLEEHIPIGIIHIVSNYLTKRNGENYFDFIMRIKRHILASYVKLADLEDNMSDLEEGSLKDKYRFAQYILRNT